MIIAALLPFGLGGVQYMGYYGFEPSSQANHTNLCTRLRARHPRSSPCTWRFRPFDCGRAA